MLRILLTLFVSAFCISQAVSQIGLMDRESLEELKTAVFQIQEKTFQLEEIKNNPNILNLAQGEVRIEVEGYLPAVLSIDSIQRSPIIYMDFAYTVLQGVEVTAKKMELWELFERVKENVPNNYIPNNVPLHYQYTALVGNEVDTLSYWSYPEVFYGTADDKYLSGNVYRKKDLVVDVQDLDTALMDAYFVYFKDVPQYSRTLNKELAKRKFKNLSEHYDIFYSGFQRDGQDFLDIVLLGREERKVDYSILYPFIKNSIENRRIDSLRYINIQNYHINLSNYALESYGSFNLTATSARLSAIRTIQSRVQLTQLITDAQQNNDPMTLLLREYRSKPELNGKYALEYLSFKNNLVLENYKADTLPTFSYFQSWYYQNPVQDPDWLFQYERTNHFAAYNFKLFSQNK